MIAAPANIRVAREATYCFRLGLEIVCGKPLRRIPEALGRYGIQC